MTRTNNIFFFCAALLLGACSSEEVTYHPKPRGYVRVDLPVQHDYKPYQSACSYFLDIPAYATMVEKEKTDSLCYMDLELKMFNATVYITYHRVNNNLPQLLEESRQLLIKHQIKATSIRDTLIVNAQDNMYGMVYTLTGNVASNIQFVATDSANHFLRGAMHFYAVPNYDSLYPMIAFIEKDMLEMVKTLRWKN